METNKAKGIIESILFAAGREVKINELMSALELSSDEIIGLVDSMKLEYEKENRGIQIINVDGSYQLCTKKENYEYIYPVFDKRSKPNLSQAAIETLSIIAYNPKITRAEIESIRGVNSDGTIYKLLDYNLIEDSGKLDAPGRPTTYSATKEFLRMFGLESLEELPDLPRYKLDENQQIVIDDLMENDVVNEENNEAGVMENKESENQKIEVDVSATEAPMPEREAINQDVATNEEVENVESNE